MAMSLVTSERGVALLPISIEAYLPRSIVSRRLKGEQPKVDLVIGYRKGNSSPILKTLLSRIHGLIGRTRRSRAKIAQLSRPVAWPGGHRRRHDAFQFGRACA